MTQLPPEHYLEEKKILKLMQRIVFSLLENRPVDPEAYIVQMLSAPGSPDAVEKWPSLYGGTVDISRPTVGGLAVATGRRQSAISPAVLTRRGCSMRRKAMSSMMNSSTDVELKVVPKDQETFKALEATVRGVNLFSFLGEEQREIMVNAMFKLSYNDGDTVITQGDKSDNFYILDKGKCDVLKKVGDKESKVAELSPGHYFGELALISGSTRAASVIARGDVVCWAIDQTTYLALMKEQHGLKRQRYRELLRNIPFLKVLQDYEILLVADALKPLTPASGDVIVNQGESGDEFYVILEGECEVKKDEKMVGTLRSGGYFGEMALMHNSPRAATVSAAGKCRLVYLDRAAFHRLLGPCSQIFMEGMKLYESTK